MSTLSTVTTNIFRQEMATKNINLSADTFNIALLNNSFLSVDPITLQNTTDWSNVSSTYSIISAGYNDITLSANVVSGNPVNGVVSWSGTNIIWNNITVDAYGYSIYRTTDNLIVGFVAFSNPPNSAVNGKFVIQWNSAGIMNIF